MEKSIIEGCLNVSKKIEKKVIELRKIKKPFVLFSETNDLCLKEYTLEALKYEPLVSEEIFINVKHLDMPLTTEDIVQVIKNMMENEINPSFLISNTFRVCGVNTIPIMMLLENYRKGDVLFFMEDRRQVFPEQDQEKLFELLSNYYVISKKYIKV